MQRQAQRLQLRRPEAALAVPANCAIAALLCLEKRCEVCLELQLASEEGGAVRVVPREGSESRQEVTPAFRPQTHFRVVLSSAALRAREVEDLSIRRY